MTIKDALGNVKKLHILTERKLKEIESKRFIALNELSRKMKASLNTLSYIPYEECAPTNLLYRGMTTDLMTSLLISQLDDTQLNDVLHIFDLEFTRSLKQAVDTDIKIRKMVYPKDAKALEEQGRKYQEDLYDDLKECLSSAKGEEWKVNSCKPITINGIKFKGTVSQMYKILESFEEVSYYAFVYKYYKLFSQSEHFSIKGRVYTHKQDFHDDYYNRVRDFIYLGTGFLYNKYNG